MRLASVLWAFVLLMPLLLFDTVFANPNAAATDDYIPEVTARVARISFLRGDVQIKRADSEDWERASLNLPIVEGDQIATEPNARLEIQFDRDSFLRLAENSYLKITTLRDEGIALSLPQGTLSLRVLNFNKDRSYFEIDAPQTTVSVQKTGMYRLDAGDKNSTEIRITATDGAEARVYSENSGFTLRSGRSATVYLDGAEKGEWQMADAARYADAWDEWVLERDAKIAKLLRDAYYDKYYDRDMYGAEDLSEYGEWIFTRKYGWVWRPYRDATSGYADWSPYRYGQWRWIPPYGWTWVNDEPWGWATYHHGRWVYINGEWCWTPYASLRPRRSWWHPALVVVTWSGNLICWYPLPYDYGYYNYNGYYHRRRRHRNNNYNNNNTGGVNPTPTPTPNIVIPAPLPGKGPKVPPLQVIPPTGVVTIAKEQFGNQIKGAKTAPLEVAKLVLSKDPDVMIKEAPPLPVGIDKTVPVRNEIIIEKPRVKTEPIARTGVIERKVGVPMDEEIRQKKVFEDRKPITRQRDLSGGEQVKGSTEGNTEVRPTGAIERSPVRPVVRQDDTNNTDNQTPRNETPVRPPRDKPRDNDAPLVKPRRDENQLPVYVPPPPREEPRERPRQEEPVRPEPPRNERPREEPRREEPRREEPRPEPRREEPKSEPKSEPKPQPPPVENKSKNPKDGLNR